MILRRGFLAGCLAVLAAPLGLLRGKPRVCEILGRGEQKNLNDQVEWWVSFKFDPPPPGDRQFGLIQNCYGQPPSDEMLLGKTIGELQAMY